MCVSMFKVDEDDQLPAVICESCLFLLNETYSFKKRSIANDAKLRQYLRKSATVVSKPSLFEDIPVKSDDVSKKILAIPHLFKKILDIPLPYPHP